MKLKLSWFLCITICLGFCVNLVKAQSPSQYFLPEVFPRSPSSTGLEKYGTYQVNEFTGIPDISIPLYTIEAGGFSVPITLSYHASGVKVTDVASWAGMGWSVASGGQVTRRTMGLPDDGTYGYLNGFMLQPGAYDVHTITGIDSLEYTANGTYDSRPDIYSYDFSGHDGKFFFDGSAGHNYIPRLLPFAPLNIKYSFVPGLGTGITKFNIADEHGDIYTFGDTGATEITESTSGGRPFGVTAASAWKIENMISQNRRDTVSFTYQQDQVYYPAADNEIYTVIDNVQNTVPGTYTPSYTNSPADIGNLVVTTEKLPQQINFKNGKVVFDLDTAQRTDLPGTGSTAYGLSDIKVYRYNYGTKTMELQKTIVFYKSYFNPTGSSRLRLDSIQVLDKAGSIIQHYRFDYNTSITLPAYLSADQDYWGYYNGSSNTMLTPLQSISYNPSGMGSNYVTIGQANRKPDSVNMQADVLTGIHYPTGGYTTFTYQTNQYDTTGVLALAGGLRIHTISSYDGINPTPIVKTYVYNIHDARPNFIFDYAYFVASQTHRYYTPGRQTIPYVAGTESVRSYSSNPHCDLEAYDGAIVVYPSVTEYIGTPGTNIGRTDYTFTDQEDALSDASAAGSLIYLSAFYVRGHLAYKKEFAHEANGTYQPVRLTYNTYTAFPYTNYSAVGLTVQKLYYNEGAAANPIEPGTATPDDSESYNPYTYDITSDDNYLTGTTTNIYDTNDTTKYTTSTVTYNYDDTTHLQIAKTVHVDSKGNTHISVNKYAFDYLSGSTTHNAVLDSMINRNMYAEAIEKWDTLKNVATSVNAVTAAQLNQFKYGTIPGTIMPSTISTLSINGPVTNFIPAYVNTSTGILTGDSRYLQMISFDNYDLQNNITQYTPKNATPTSIMWNYLYESPVAQVKNATNAYSGSSDLFYTSFEADNQGNWLYSGTPVADPTAPTGSYSYPLSSGSVYTAAIPSTLTYVLSLWSNGGAPTVNNGSTNLTGTALNTVNGWIYYEYQVPTGSSSINISGSTSIDELRMYPSNAQMTTYAYAPSGLTSISDTKGANSYFEYDYFQRLQNMKDWAGNINKNYGYHTYDQTVASQVQMGTFTRNNCPSGTTPGSAPYTVAAGKYLSSTLASANAEALYDLNINGQINANLVCGCPVTTISFTLSNSTGISGFQATFSGISTPYNFPATGSTVVQVPPGTYATVYIGPVGSATHTFTLGTGTPIVGHSATFDSVYVQTGSSTLSLSIQ
jgi:hypothetical protein